MTLVDHRAAVAGTAGRSPATRPLDDRWDLPALAGLLALAVAVHAVTHRGGVLLGMDVATQFVPWFGWMGEQLRAGVVPAWNPAVLSGTPAAGDPLSGWGYVPAMLAFGLLPLRWAVHTFLIAQVGLVATGTYLLARTLRLPVGGALIAAIVAAFNGFVFQRALCCEAFVSVEAWIPWLLLGIDRGLATTGARRVGAWALAGFALSQVAGGWLGQGTLYVVALAMVWTVARAGMLTPDRRAWVRTLAVNAGGLAVAGAGLSAAVVLPRLQINPQTTLAGGYPEQNLSAWYSGWWPTDWTALVHPGIWHAGWLPVALALAALVLARRDGLTWLLGGIAAGTLLLAMPVVTPADLLVLWIPNAEHIHTHVPQRAALLLYPMIALLAGMAVACLRPRLPGRAAWVPALVAIALVGGELAWANTSAVRTALAADRNPDLLRRVDVDDLYAPSAAGRYLQRRAADGDIGRYAAFRPIRRSDGRVTAAAYFISWQRDGIQMLEPHNEALLLGLEHVQGYNPTHLARYDDVITAANGRPQDYHVANVAPEGLNSGIFDLLNGRWLVMHRRFDHTDPDLVGPRVATWPVAWQDHDLVVLENPDALPRAWLVGDARQVAPGDAPALLADRSVDPRRTALLEVPPPHLHAGATGTARVVSRDTGGLVVDVAADGDALLVLSEVADPAWTATVDGAPADVLVADHVLRAVPVPAGRHRVALTFDRTVITGALAVTALTALGLLGAAGWAVLRRRGRRGTTPGTAAGDATGAPRARADAR